MCYTWVDFLHRLFPSDWEKTTTNMGNFATARAAVLILALVTSTAEAAAEGLPSKLAYTFYLRGSRVGQASVTIQEKGEVLRLESKLHVETAKARLELSTHTEADPKTFALRSFAYEGVKGKDTVATSVTVLGDSVYGFTATNGKRQPQARRVNPHPILVWEDWVPDIEILLALQQAREFKNPSTRGLLLAGSYASSIVTVGYSGEVVVESATKSMVARKLLVAIQGGDPFESLIDPKRGVPVYIRFPGIGAEIFLDDFFGDNPISRYKTPESPATGG